MRHPEKAVRLLTVLLCICLCFGGCAGNEEPEISTAETLPETEAAVPDVELSSYIIVRPDNPSMNETDMLLKVKADLAGYGITAAVKTDWEMPGTVLPEEAKEILIGMTSRSESEQYKDSLRQNDSVVKIFPGGRIVILGGNAASLEKATDAFIAAIVSGDDGKGAYIPGALEINTLSSYTLDDFRINGIAVNEYEIVIPRSANRDENYAAALISEAIASLTGFSLPVVKEAAASRAHFIYVGCVSGTSVPENGYSIESAGGNVYISGKTAFCVMAARAFISSVVGKAADSVINASQNGGSYNAELPARTEYVYKNPDYPALEGLGDIPVATTDQQAAKAIFYDLAPVLEGGSAKNTYTFRPLSSLGFKFGSDYGTSIDETKIRYSEFWNSYLILFTSSAGFVGVAKYPSGEKVWQQNHAGDGPHSIEYLPNGCVALALSGNGDESRSCVYLYNIAGSLAAPYSCKSALEGAHAVVWDDIRGVLWAFGYSEIVAYEIVGSAKYPELKKISAYCVKASTGGHDMTVITGNTDLMMLSGSSAWIFDRSTGGLTKNVTDTWGISSGSIKCLGTLIYKNSLLTVRTVATNVFKEHDTDTLTVFRAQNTSLNQALLPETITVRLDGAAFYKARVIDPYYFNLK